MMRKTKGGASQSFSQNSKALARRPLTHGSIKGKPHRLNRAQAHDSNLVTSSVRQFSWYNWRPNHHIPSTKLRKEETKGDNKE